MMQSKSSQDKKGVYLEDVLESLQKTFSRLSSRTAAVDPSQPVALITGPVNFTMRLRIEPERDYLRTDREGSVEITLEGQVEPDVRYEERTQET